jgi:hypothetical protein
VHENHAPIVSGGGIKGFVKAMLNEDAMVSRFGILGLMNLTTLPQNHREVMNCNCCDILISLAAGMKKKWNSLNSLGVDLIEGQEPNSPRQRGDASFIAEHGYDRDSRRYAVLALGNLSLSKDNHVALMSDQCLAVLNGCLDSQDDETRFNAAFAFNKLTIESDNIKKIGESGVIVRLIDCLQSGGPDTVGQAIGALRHMAEIIDNRILMLNAMILEPLSDVAKSSDFETLREVAGCLCLLSLTEAIRLPIVASSVLVPLMNLCAHEDVEIARQACGAIANIAESKRTHKQLATVANAMHTMIFIMRSKHLAVHREAARAVANMLSSTAFHRLFLDDSGLNSLFRLCRSLDVETLYNCSIIFRKLSPVLANHEYIISKGGLAPLQLLTRTNDLQVNRQATAALRDVASNVNFKAIMAEEGCLVRSIELARDDDLQLRILAMGVIRHLSINTRASVWRGEEENLPVSLSLSLFSRFVTRMSIHCC